MSTIRAVAIPTLLILLALLAIAAFLLVIANPTAAQSRPSSVTNIAVCNGANAGETIISWDVVPEATHYRVGYVNMQTDYPIAKTSVTGDWINAFIYVDENALNIPVANGRATYTVRRLERDVRHAFTILAGNNFVDTGHAGSVTSEFFWPVNPRWTFLTIAAPDPNCTANSLQPVAPTPTATPRSTPTPTLRPTPTITPSVTPTRRPTGRAISGQVTECSIRGLATSPDVTIRGTVRALRTVYDVVVYGSIVRSHLPEPNDIVHPVGVFGSHRLGNMVAGETRSFNISYRHQILSTSETCYAIVIYNERPSSQRQNQMMPMNK